MELPELEEAHFSNADVTVVFEAVPCCLVNAKKVRESFEATEEQLLLRVNDVGRFLVEEGKHIRIDLDDGSDDRSVRLFLLGSCFGAILHQRGVMPLHASAIDTPRGAILICGNSGMGKSTTVTALVDRGYRMITDDVAALRKEGGRFWLETAYPQVKLWENSLQHLGKDTEGLDQVRPELSKRVLRLGSSIANKPCKVLGLVWFYFGEGPSLREARGNERFFAIKKNVYRRSFLTPSRKRSHYARCIDLARQLPIYCLERPETENSIDRVVGLIELLAKGDVEVFHRGENDIEFEELL